MGNVKHLEGAITLNPTPIYINPEEIIEPLIVQMEEAFNRLEQNLILVKEAVKHNIILEDEAEAIDA